MLTKNNIIDVYGWNEICDYSHNLNDSEIPAAAKIIGCEISEILPLFELLSHYSNRKFILLTFASDFGLCYQQEHFSNLDVFKAYYRVDWNQFEKEKEYGKVVLAACLPERCDISHKYSVKMDGFTNCTFDKIPENIISWYTCNSNINDPRVHFLPFGVLNVSNELIEVGNKSWEKWDKLYINFDVNTHHRFLLKKHYRNLSSIQYTNVTNWVTFREKAIPYKDFLEEFAQHKFILSPKGNSMGDGYRHWESLYLGNLPIIENSRWARSLVNEGYPIAIIDDMFSFTKKNIDELKSFYSYFSYKLKETSHLLDKQWWFNKIRSEAKDI